MGGDSNILCAITEAVAEAYYGVNKEMQAKVLSYLDATLKIRVEEAELLAKKLAKK